MSDIYKMKLHEHKSIDGKSITRVPGGWIYRVCHQNLDKKLVYSTLFVPFNNEFQRKSDE